MQINKILHGDALLLAKTLPKESVNCIVTSPPYWGLRDYGKDGQLGLERTPEEYVTKLVKIFNEIKRVLKKDGTMWLNLGDTYSNHKDCKSTRQTIVNHDGHIIPKDKSFSRDSKLLKSVGLKNKDLVGIPWRVALALQADGWYFRQDIIWSKPNPMPESVTDRCTKSHEYIFLLTKSPKYYYDHEAIKEKSIDPESFRGKRDRKTPTMYKTDKKNYKFAGSVNKNGIIKGGKTYEKKNKRSVWEINTTSYSGAHFATFPEKLIVPMIKAGCPEGGIVLDPFIGAGTTAIVARKLMRNYIGIELNEEYIKIANERIYKELGMFK